MNSPMSGNLHLGVRKFSFAFSLGVFPNNCQWEFQDPTLEVPTIYKAYFLGLCKGIYPQNMARNMVLT